MAQAVILKCNEALTGCPDALFNITIIAVILLFADRMLGTNIHGGLVKGVMQISTVLKQLLIWLALYTFGSMTTGAHASDQNERHQIRRIPSNPNAWETIKNALQAYAVPILAALIGILIFKIVNRPLRAVPDAAQALPEAAPALPEVAPALPIYPAVQGDDIDDVLKNAPVATRRNSPLESWL